LKLSNSHGGQLEAAAEPVAIEALSALVILLPPSLPPGPRSCGNGWLGKASVQPPALARGPIPPPLIQDTVQLVIQVKKAKVRGQLEVPADADAATLERSWPSESEIALSG